MLLKFLPFSQKKEKNQIPSPQQNLQSEKQDKAFLNVGLNLLSDKPKDLSIQKSRFTPDNPDSLIYFFKKLIFVLCFIMSFIIIFNFLILFTTNYLKVKQNDLVKQIKTYAEVETTARSVDKKIAYYKQIVAQRKNISPKVEFIIGKIESDTNISRVKYTSTNFVLFADGPDAYTFTRLIFEYLKGDVVSEISIKGARLDTRAGRFEIDMEGIFK